uniref:Ammonium transporter n=1 Tax=Ganoderma boninense TaxID=34458 RepID=A0A5K1K4C5_9APHY|nr:Ammonium transporter [Ganoderma boninense]
MPSAPRWLELIKIALNHPSNKGQVIYQVATVDANGHPRVRSQVHRGFMEPDGHPELPLLVTSTDARTPKVAQVRSNQRVELAWWMEGTRDQFRISGFVHIVPSPAKDGPTSIPVEATTLKSLEESGFDFEAKRKETFDLMNTGMRASWCVPLAPGTVISSYEEQKAWPSDVPLERDAQTDGERKNIEVSFSNFALMLVEPVQVDWVSLGVMPYSRVGFKRDGDKWIEQQLVP